MTVKSFPLFGRTIQPDSFMNVDKELYDDLVLRKRVAVPMADYMKNKNEEDRLDAMNKVDELETAAERILESEKEAGVQHIVVHHVDGQSEEE